MTNPQLSLILQTAPYYENSLPLPYELLMKVFHYVVEISDHPIRDLCNLARVCETWRVLVLGSPTLWSRLNFNELPMTDGNLQILAEIIEKRPAIIIHISEISIRGKLRFKSSKSSFFVEELIAAPNLKELNIEDLDSIGRKTGLNQISRAIAHCGQLRKLSIKNTRSLVGHQKWLADFLMDNGKYLEELHLTSSISAVSSALFRSIASDYCPLLRVIDLSTCDFVNTRSFDAIQLAQNAPNLEVLRVANVSFKRVYYPPEVLSLKRLEELSMPIGMRDAERDDALLATLTYGSNRVTTLDLRGSSITANALENLPSYNLRELHIDDICPITRRLYHKFIKKWRHSLEVLSLVKINCPETIRTCLFSLTYDNDEDYENPSIPRKQITIREVDLESSDVTLEDLRRFLSKATTLETLNLSSCRSLPRGCKGRYGSNPSKHESQLYDLKRRLGSNHTDSETEIDEENEIYRNQGEAPRLKKRRRADKNVRRNPDYVYDF